MNELEQLRDQLIGLRGQVSAALDTVERLLAALADAEEEQDQRPATYGGRR